MFGSHLGYQLLVIAALSLTFAQADDLELQRLQAIAANVTIIRDDFGVPHIYGKTDAEAVFGLLYAQAEDDFNRVEHNYIWAIGRLAEIEGKEALASDLRARLYMTRKEAKKAYESAPDWLKDLCNAFADGLNYYLATHPEVKPALITHFEPWMPMYFSEGSIGGDIESVPLDGINDFYGQGTLPSLPEELSSALKEPVGSNGFAISGSRTKSGNTMLLINPHTSFYFRGEVHVISEEGLDAYGAVTWGQFFVYQGFNEHNGWMHTSTRVDFMDEFVENVFVEDKQLVYQYGKETRPVETSNVTLKYKVGDTLLDKKFTLLHTHHGPFTGEVNGKWVTTKLNWDPVNALSQSFIRTKTKNHTEFRKMMDIRTNSSNNTVYADANGNIAYYHGNFIPRRDPQYDYSKPVDGTNPETDWQGLHKVDEIITLLNPKNGWLQNCNSTPFTAAAQFSPMPEDFPVYMAPDKENFRGLHAVQMLKNTRELTLDSLIELAYDPYLPGFEVLIPGLIKAYEENKDKKLHAAVEILENWDLKSGVESVAMTLAHYYGTNYIEQGDNPLKLSGRELVNYFGDSSPLKERLDIFSSTLNQLEKGFGRWQIPWGEVNRFQRITGDILQPHDDSASSEPVGLASGRWGALASFGAKQFEGTKKLYGYGGNSFVAVVEFGEKVKAKSLLAGGQSGDPLSPHFSDQVDRYLDRDFKEVAYYLKDVKQRAEEIYQPGKR